MVVIQMFGGISGTIVEANLKTFVSRMTMHIVEK
jgi:hypothetical protein